MGMSHTIFPSLLSPEGQSAGRIRRLRFRPHLLVRSAGPDAAVVFAPQKDSLLEGRGYGTVVDSIDGKCSSEEVVRKLQSNLTKVEVHQALECFRRRGMLMIGGDSRPGPEETFWSSFEKEDFEGKPLGSGSVEVLATDQKTAQRLLGLLVSSGLQAQARGDLRIVIASDYCDEQLGELNQRALSHNRPWMLLRPRGREIWVGPIFVPGRTACWQCLAHRMEENLWLRHCIGSDQRSVLLAAARGNLEAGCQAALSLASVEVVKWFRTELDSPLCGRIWTFDLGTLESRFHPVTPRPQCSQCGRPRRTRLIVPGTVGFADPEKRFLGKTSYRCCPPRETLKRLEKHISPITGIIAGQEERETGLDGAYVCVGRYATATTVYSSSSRLGGRPGVAVGKGFARDDARASMLAEAVERYCASFQGDEHLLKGRYGELSERMIHPGELLHISQEQYRIRHRNPDLPAIHQIPDPFDETAIVEWAPARSLTDGETYLLPAGYCYSRYPMEEGHEFCMADSNGCASGNCWEEAVVQGFLELVERDAVAIWWYNKIRRRAVALETFGGEWPAQAQERFASSGRSLHVLDLTSDLKIPVFAAISAKADGRGILLGLGAHFDAEVALHRALAELVQVLVFWPADEQASEAHDPALDLLLSNWAERTMPEDPYLLPSSQPAAVSGEFGHRQSLELEQDLEACLQVACKNHLNLLVLDQTRPDIDLSAVRVAAPGLRHFWPRFGPGRLYDVPVRMGWMSLPRQEEELNRFGFFL